MYKTLKKLLVLALTVLFALSCPLTSFALAQLDEYDLFLMNLPAATREALVRQEPAVEAADNLQAAFAVSDAGETLYPADFGGMYIDHDRNYKLVIQLVGTTAAAWNTYTADLKNSEDIIFENVQYSMAYLESLSSYAEALKQDFTVVEFYVDVIENKFVIGVLDSEYAAFLSSAFYAECAGLPIRFEACAQGAAYTSLIGGMNISCPFYLGTTIVNLGVCGTYNSQNAVLTCAHGNSTLNGGTMVLEPNDVSLGNINYFRLNVINNDQGTASKGDFAIITLNSTHTTTNKVYNNSSATTTKSISGIRPTFTIGQTIAKYGSATGYTSMAVTALNAYHSYSFPYTYLQGSNYVSSRTYVYTYGLIKTGPVNGNAAPIGGVGDSGGPVFTTSGIFCGIVTSGPSSSSSGNYMYFTPIKLATDIGFAVKTS